MINNEGSGISNELATALLVGLLVYAIVAGVIALVRIERAKRRAEHVIGEPCSHVRKIR